MRIIRKYIYNHSLSIVLLTLGVAATSVALYWIEDQRSFDLVLGIGQSLLTVGFINLLKGPLVEKNREDVG